MVAFAPFYAKGESFLDLEKGPQLSSQGEFEDPMYGKPYSVVLGIKRYAPAVLGKLCRNGHKHHGSRQSLRFRSNGQCVVCFYTVKKRWLKQHAQRHREQSLASYWRHRDKVLKRLKKYHASRRGKLRFKFYFSKPAVKARWRINERRFRSSPKGKLYVAQKNHRRNLLKHGGKFTKVMFSSFQKLRALFNGKCAYCSNLGSTIDHFIPVCRGGEHALGNLLPACRPCNVHKNGKEPIPWFKSRPSYTVTRLRRIRKALRMTL